MTSSLNNNSRMTNIGQIFTFKMADLSGHTRLTVFFLIALLIFNLTRRKILNVCLEKKTVLFFSFRGRCATCLRVS